MDRTNRENQIFQMTSPIPCEPVLATRRTPQLVVEFGATPEGRGTRYGIGVLIAVPRGERKRPSTKGENRGADRCAQLPSEGRTRRSDRHAGEEGTASTQERRQSIAFLQSSFL